MDPHSGFWDGTWLVKLKFNIWIDMKLIIGHDTDCIPLIDQNVLSYVPLNVFLKSNNSDILRCLIKHALDNKPWPQIKE